MGLVCYLICPPHELNNPINMCCNFIEEYLLNPSQAVANARMSADERFGSLCCPDDDIYSQLSSPEYRLYEQITLS